MTKGVLSTPRAPRLVVIMVGFGMPVGAAAAAILGNNMLAKLYMSFGMRAPVVFDKSKTEEEKDKTFASKAFSKVHKAQLNENEYAAPIAIPLIYLALKGVESPIGALLCVVSQVASL